MTALDAWLAAAAVAGLWTCLGWLAVGFAVSALAEAPGAIGRASERLADRISPQLVRRVARCTAGLVLTTSSVVGTAATAATGEGSGWPSEVPASERSGWPSQPVPGDPSVRQLPDLDRPALPAAWPVNTAAPVPTLAPGSPTAVGQATAPSRAMASGRAPTTIPRLPTVAPWPDATTEPDASAESGPTAEAGLRPSCPDRLPRPGGAASRPVTHVVAPGDTLWGIAARELGSQPTNRAIAERWPRWYTANRAVIGPDPDLLLPGQRLSPPG